MASCTPQNSNSKAEVSVPHQKKMQFSGDKSQFTPLIGKKCEQLRFIHYFPKLTIVSLRYFFFRL